jgi:hypothetical protein
LCKESIGDKRGSVIERPIGGELGARGGDRGLDVETQLQRLLRGIKGKGRTRGRRRRRRRRRRTGAGK